MNTLIINKEDLTHNINVIKNEVNMDKYTIIGVVKGNGYGLGLRDYSEVLLENGIKMLAVATTIEAIELREFNKEVDILDMSSTCIKSELEELITNNIIIAIGSKKCAEIVNEIAKEGKKIRAHIKIDTGFGRYGFLEEEEIINTIKSLNENVSIEGIFSHFSIAYYKNNESTINQYNKFVDIIKELEKQNIYINLKHICNSPAFINYPEMRLNAARIGSAFLGRVDCFNNLKLRKIGILKSQISEIKTLPKGFYVGYLNSYKTKKITTIAIVPIGYGDGYNITLKNDMFRFVDKLRSIKHLVFSLSKKEHLTVSINGNTYPILGKVGMFHIAVDITGSDLKIGDEVLLEANPIYINSNVRREYV